MERTIHLISSEIKYKDNLGNFLDTNTVPSIQEYFNKNPQVVFLRKQNPGNSTIFNYKSIEGS
jgi:hypothetical protein